MTKKVAPPNILPESEDLPHNPNWCHFHPRSSMICPWKHPQLPCHCSHQHPCLRHPAPVHHFHGCQIQPSEACLAHAVHAALPLNTVGHCTRRGCVLSRICVSWRYYYFMSSSIGHRSEAHARKPGMGSMSTCRGMSSEGTRCAE
ncbi:hypothetical protein B0H10DRAFT_986366 [Mycena sp. CBHHK59/15]|nr:hypothetical protein B0H10DRAFT_986366 [Mycena sp. CBHHK59/15]